MNTELEIKKQTNWDYTHLAAHYLKRPDYAQDAIDQLCELAGLKPGMDACDVGAGSAHLTKLLVRKGLLVTAVEPNDAMRAVGQSVTSDLPVTWHIGTGEKTGQAEAAFDAVTFGSSFNTTERQDALRETARILRPRGWFACMWNHRDLNDPVQKRVEDYIRSQIESYGYGTRREDQTEVIHESGLFEEPVYIEGTHIITLLSEDYVEAWRSHATLQRQAGERMGELVKGIEGIVCGHGEELAIGYTTRLWAARLK
ncbi:MAG: class I SAM-dependent methyltransferase [Verrucomicrobiota bacterium]|jgi:ubiquinone/menaquinone biosynthesis C-methylase UbiE|nr:class I SAM-dependent methyltransferase [Verrucomicrobiota bacterium]